MGWSYRKFEYVPFDYTKDLLLTRSHHFALELLGLSQRPMVDGRLHCRLRWYPHLRCAIRSLEACQANKSESADRGVIGWRTSADRTSLLEPRKWIWFLVHLILQRSRRRKSQIPGGRSSSTGSSSDFSYNRDAIVSPARPCAPHCSPRQSKLPRQEIGTLLLLANCPLYRCCNLRQPCA
jgi:hypothetical protein